MISQQAACGGRGGARRFLLAATSMLCVLSGPRAIASTEPHLSVQEQRGIYTVTARFLVPQPPSIALAVLTDYEEIPRFMPDVKTSIVRERSVGRAVVEQEAVSRVMMFSKRIHLLLNVHEEGDTVHFRDACGHSFTRYAGAWRLSLEDGQTVITYELMAQPSFDVPDFLLKRVLKRDAKDMIERLRKEIATRPADASRARAGGR